MSETCENWIGLVNSCVYYAPQIREIYQVLPYSEDFNQLSKRVLSKRSFISKTGPVNICNERKARNNMHGITMMP